MYVLTRRDLPGPVQAVQAAHAVLEAARTLPLSADHPHLVLLSVRDETRLGEAAQAMTRQGIAFCAFREPDRDNELTALATAPLQGEARRFFRRYQLLKEKSHATGCNCPPR